MDFQDFFGVKKEDYYKKIFYSCKKIIFFTNNYIDFVLSNQHAILNTLYTLHTS